MFWATLRETELLGQVGGSGLRGLELAGWGGLKELERAGQEPSGGHWGCEFCARKFGFLCTESRNNLEFVTVGRKMDSVLFMLSFWSTDLKGHQDLRGDSQLVFVGSLHGPLPAMSLLSR